MSEKKKMYKLLGADGEIYLSETPGTFGGNGKLKIYGIVKKSGPTLVKTHILWGTHFTGPIFRSYLCL